MFLAAFVSPLIAQENAPTKDPVGGIRIRLHAEPAPETLGKVFLQFGETKSKAFTLTTNRLADPIPVGQRLMVLTYYDIAFATREPTGDKLLSSSRWPVENHLRTYLFFFTNAQGRTTFRGVDEYLTADKPANP